MKTSWQRLLLQVSLASALLGSVVAAQAGITVGWHAPAGTSAQVGSTLRLQMVASGFTSDPGSSLGLFDFDILYSPSLRFVGGSFDPAGVGANPLALPEVGASSFLGDFVDDGSRVDVFGLSGNTQAVLDADQPDSFLLFEMHFEARSADSAAFVELALSDPFLLFGSSDPTVVLSPLYNPANLTLSLTSAVPEPPSALLFLLGAVGIPAVRRRARLATMARRASPVARLSAVVLAGLSLVAVSGPGLAAAPVAPDTPVSGVVTQVKGGRITVRMDNGQIQQFSVFPGTVKQGQRIQAVAQRAGDAVRLNGIQIQR